MGSERGDVAEAARREVEDARARLSEAAGRVRQEAMSAGSTISQLVYDELDRRGADLSDGLQHIAEKMRGVADSAEADPPRMVQQAVDVIEDLSHRLRNQSARDLSGRLAQFGRENPVTFMAACLATGVLAGRFLIAQTDDGAPTDDRNRDTSGSSEWAGGPYGRQDWQGTPGSRQGDFGYREPADLDTGDWTGSAGFAAGSEGGALQDDMPSDLDLGPEDRAGTRQGGPGENPDGIAPTEREGAHG